MDVQCSYEGCKGSPKNSCSCDKTQKFCEFHIEKHLELSGDHSLYPVTSTAVKTSTLLADEMKQLSSTMTKVMSTGKDMFQEICRKLCEITSELTERQDKLIEMASNLSTSEAIPTESFKRLGDLGLNFKSADEFGKLVNEHFSKDSAKIDFSFFSKDIENIMNHLKESNSLLQTASSQSEADSQNRKKIESKLTNLESITSQIEQNLTQKINQLDSETQEREQRFAYSDTVKQLEERVNLLEGLINNQNKSIEAVNLNFNNINNELATQDQLNHEREKRLAQFASNAQNQLNLQFNQLRGAVELRVVEINQVVEENLKAVQEAVNKTHEEFRGSCDAKIDGLNEGFLKFCDGILERVKGLTENYQGQILQFSENFTPKVRKEIDDYQQFKVDEAERIRRELEEEERRKKEAEELRRVQEENERKRQEEEERRRKLLEEENKRKQDEEIKRRQEEERKRKEAEELEKKLKEDARRKKEEEDKRIENDRKKKEEEEKNKKLQEERKFGGKLN